MLRPCRSSASVSQPSSARISIAPPSIFADPVRNARIGLESLLDIMNIQGPKLVAYLRAIMVAARAESQPYPADAVARIEAAASRALAEEIQPGIDKRCSHSDMIHRHIAIALKGLSTQLLDKLSRVVTLSPSWKFEGSGRVDRPPKLSGPDAEISFSQDELHCVRHVLFSYLPGWTTLDQVVDSRRTLLYPRAARAPPRGGGLPSPSRAASAPCALITVGPVGAGKSWVLHGSDSRIGETLARCFGHAFPAPPLSEFSILDPDAVLHGLAAGMGQPFDPTLRSYANFVNHENFLCAVQARRHMIFDGSGRDPTNICGRVISRLRAHGYRVVFLVVLTSFATARRRALERERRTGRATSEGFTRFIYRSLQSALPIYLRGCGESPRSAAEGMLLYTNDADGERPVLAHTLVGAQRVGKHEEEHAAALEAALRTCSSMLQLPPEPPKMLGRKPMFEEDDDSALSMGELLAAAGVLIARLHDAKDDD